MSTVTGFFGGFGLFSGYLLGLSFVILAAIKPLFPDNIGIWVDNESISNGLDIAWRMGGRPSACARRCEPRWRGSSCRADGGKGPVTIRSRRE